MNLCVALWVLLSASLMLPCLVPVCVCVSVCMPVVVQLYLTISLSPSLSLVLCVVTPTHRLTCTQWSTQTAPTIFCWQKWERNTEKVHEPNDDTINQLAGHVTQNTPTICSAHIHLRIFRTLRLAHNSALDDLVSLSHSIHLLFPTLFAHNSLVKPAQIEYLNFPIDNI